MVLRGAGILLVESYRNDIVVTLFGKDGLNYSDVGGKIDFGELPEEAAYREGREETANLINISPDELNSLAARIEFNGYMAYIMYVEGISFKDYINNINIVFGQCDKKQNHWKEMNGMARIPLNNIIVAAQNHVNLANDVDGQPVDIRPRTMAIVRAAGNILNTIYIIRPVKLHRHLVTSSRLPCLIGTYTYTVTEAAIYSKSPTTFGNQDTKYGIYAVPDLTNYSHPFLRECGPKKWGGIHITIAGFHKDNGQSANKMLKYISEQGDEKWTISINKIKVKGNTIYFPSETLNAVASFLNKNGFFRVKNNWHITSECVVPNDIKSILKDLTWSLALIKEKNGVIKWLRRYPLHIL